MKAHETLGLWRRRRGCARRRKETSKYEMTRASPMQEGLALVDVGWIDWVRAKMMYMAARFAVAAKAMADLLPCPRASGESSVAPRSFPFRASRA